MRRESEKECEQKRREREFKYVCALLLIHKAEAIVVGESREPNVLYRRDAAAQRISPDRLSMMCTSAVRESLAYVYGDRLDEMSRWFNKKL
ncbi:hypothetical protein K1719_015061 [Acacia pycnantha]|nr:hypothetical protein K1719_015061 [Acacia pycnantha]